MGFPETSLKTCLPTDSVNQIQHYVEVVAKGNALALHSDGSEIHFVEKWYSRVKYISLNSLCVEEK